MGDVVPKIGPTELALPASSCRPISSLTCSGERSIETVGHGITARYVASTRATLYVPVFAQSINSNGVIPAAYDIQIAVKTDELCSPHTILLPPPN